jgi:hypothetical protein
VSSLLLSPTCLSPIDGLVDFAREVKPFHTKILDTGITLAFRDSIAGGITEQYHALIEQRFDYAMGVCFPDILPCDNQGFEVELFDDMGFEPTTKYEVKLEHSEYPTGTYNVHGNPLFYHFNLCLDEGQPQGIRNAETTVLAISAADDLRVRVSLLHPSKVVSGDQIEFTTISSIFASSDVEHVISQIAGKRFELRLVDPSAFDSGSWFRETYLLVDTETDQFLTHTNPFFADLIDLGYRIRLRDAGQIICGSGFEFQPFEVALYDSSGEQCESTCDGQFAGGVDDGTSPASPTTISTSINESLIIIDDFFVEQTVIF